MPNLLAHYGAQGPLTRAVLPGVDLKWILTGCLLPDLPWILQRGATVLLPGLVDPYDLRLYLTVQASLLFCLLLALALAALTPRPRLVFGVLALNSLLALVLDALQTKWAAGVHLLAPFTWEPWSAGLFWPESAVTAAITLGGAAFLAWAAFRDPPGPGVPLRLEPGPRLLGAGAAGLAYVLLPLLFMTGAEEGGSHYIDVLRDRDRRPGRYVEFDRASYLDRPGADLLRTFGNDELVLRGIDLDSSGSVSVRGRFASADTLRVTAYHRHRSGLRDFASYAALAALLLVWGRDVRRGVRARAGRADEPG